MGDVEYAGMMLELAQGDLEALAGMQDKETFENRIFGFHAQQAVEKALKAWISVLGKEHPISHDIGRLFNILEENGCDVERFSPLTKYDAFAVRLRYLIPRPPAQPLDRPATLAEVRKLVEHVEKLIGQTETSD